MEFNPLTFLLLSVSVSLLARLEIETAMCDSECIGRIPALASSIAFLSCKRNLKAETSIGYANSIVSPIK
jgi:hypothetical protein